MSALTLCPSPLEKVLGECLDNFRNSPAHTRSTFLLIKLFTHKTCESGKISLKHINPKLPKRFQTNTIRQKYCLCLCAILWHAYLRDLIVHLSRERPLYGPPWIAIFDHNSRELFFNRVSGESRYVLTHTPHTPHTYPLHITTHITSHIPHTYPTHLTHPSHIPLTHLTHTSHILCVLCTGPHTLCSLITDHQL